MASQPDTNVAALCRICIRDVSDVPAVNIFEPSSKDPSIYSKLSIICSKVFASEPEPKPLAQEEQAKEKGLPVSVCPECKSKIDQAFDLHELCIESDRKLWEMLTDPVGVVIKHELGDVILPEKIQQLPEVFTECLSELPLNVQHGAAKEDPKKCKAKTKGRRQFRCEKCTATTDRAFGLYKHMRLKHPKEALVCYYRKCHQVFFDEVKFQEHRKTHTVVKLNEPQPCPNCGKLFKSLDGIKAHADQCAGNTPFLCTECGKAYSYAASLRQHVMRHKEKSFECDQCPVKFHTNISLKKHMLTHTKERKFSCDTCGSRFTMKHTLLKHIQLHTGVRPFSCDLCSLRFTNSGHLQRHMRTHTGEKPYKCPHCDRAFAQTGDLAKHSKTHFGANPYKCDQCDEAFRLMTDLRNHYRLHYQASDKEKPDRPETFDFTIVSTLRRRAEQEKHSGSRKVDQPLDKRRREVGMVQTILADLSEFPTSVANKQ
nr:zinc finger protein OZF-like [Aedes albopictus]XP_029730671.1 zinc finger protein OZF-like [Aedes albopictus]